ncbi:MAG: DUF4153 domain-containing protein [Albidovulum sp.]
MEHFNLTIRGLPPALMRDAWWLGGAESGPPVSGHPPVAGGAGRRLLALALLLVLGDFLFHDRPPGLSLAIFGLAILAASGALLRWRAPVAGPAALALVAVLPVVEYVQTLSVAFLLTGLPVALAWMLFGSAAPLDVLRRAWRLVEAVPLALPRDVFALSRCYRSEAGGGASLRRWARSWAFPLGGVIVLVALLADANPVLSGWIDAAFRFNLDLADLTRRVMLWGGLALMLWPVLDPVPPEPTPLNGRSALPALRLPGLNAASVANALVLFNLVLGAQTCFDFGYLWSGSSLPAGMSHAAYAHRGAYPLLATALLAGGFALAARPWLEERPGLVWLMALWLGQNVLLCLSAVYRLSLYTERYGLTHLRVHAGIWMALVAVGLVLVGWQIWWRRSNLWLVARVASVGLGTLYLCAFVNFAGMIAAHNLKMQWRSDITYLCGLGETAAAELYAERRSLPCRIDAPATEGWRDWGFRKWRVNRYLEAEVQAEFRHEDPGR